MLDSEEKQYTFILQCCKKQYQTIPHKIHYQKQKAFILLKLATFSEKLIVIGIKNI